MSKTQDYAEYLRKRVANSMRVDNDFKKSYVSSVAKNGSVSAPEANAIIGLRQSDIVPENRNYAMELENLLQSFFRPEDAYKFAQDKQLTPQMKMVIVDNFHTDIAPNLAQFKGKYNVNPTTIVSFLKRVATELGNVELEAEALERNKLAANTFKDKDEAFVQLVFRAKALHNSRTLVARTRDSFRGGKPTKGEIPLIIVQEFFAHDRVYENLTVAVSNASGKPFPGAGYELNLDEDELAVALNKHLKSFNKSTFVDAYFMYHEELVTYQSLRLNARNHFALAVKIMNNEGHLNGYVKELLKENKVIGITFDEFTTLAQLNSSQPVPFMSPTKGPAPAPPSTPARTTSTTVAPIVLPSSTSGSSAFVPIATSSRGATPVTGATPGTSSGTASVRGATPATGAVAGTSAGSPVVDPGSTVGSGVAKPRNNKEVALNSKYYINTGKLSNGIIEIRYIKNRHLVPVKIQAVSPLFRDMVFKRLNGDMNPDRESYVKLTDTEKHLFRSITKYLDMDGGSLPDVSEIMDRKAQVVFGQLRAGNNNPEIKREAFLLLRHAYSVGKLSSNDFNSLIRTYNL